MELSESLLELVRTEARRIQRRLPPHALSLDDLTGHGHVGLVEARDRFDPRHGVPFVLFARRRVRGAILDALRTQGLLGRRGWEDLRRQAVAHELLEADPRPDLGPDDDAAALGETVQRLALAFLTDATLHVQATPEDPEANLVETQLGARLRTAIEALPDEDREVVYAVYDFHEAGDSGAELARRKQVSRSHVSRSHLRILESLRSALGAGPS